MKIKKHAVRILMFIMLVGLFVPVIQVSAQDMVDPNTGEVVPAPTGVSPSLLAAQKASNVCVSVQGLGNIICRIQQILNSILPMLLALGVVYFVWGVVQYVIGNDEEAKKKGKNRIVYGIIGFAVIIGLWGLVNIVVKTFDIGGQNINLSSLTPTQASGTQSDCSAPTPNSKFQDYMKYATCIINGSVIPLVFAIASVTFVWGVVQFVINSDDEAKKTKGKNFMIWGVIALTVMICVWGLVAILGNTFGVNSSFVPQVKAP